VKRRLVVIGGGIVGLATAHQYLRANPGASVVVLEKEDEVGRHQSGHNSGVLHAGLYYRPGSRKALLARSGLREMTEFCQEHEITHEICGKLVVAADESEVPRLEQLMERGIANGLTGLRRLGKAEAREIEPHVGGVAAVHVPEEGIVDYPAVCRTLASLIVAAGGSVRTRSRVVGIRRDGSGWVVETERGERAEAFAAWAGQQHGVDAQPVSEAEVAARGADILCTVTSSPEPVLLGEWVAPGAHVNAVGAFAPTTRELDTALVARSAFYVDSRESAELQAGDWLLAKEEAGLGAEHIRAELGEVVAGAPGRSRPDEVTVFKSLGLGVEA
jgi:glycine/D-amino acid oxidase-like deaminating enzyme